MKWSQGVAMQAFTKRGFQNEIFKGGRFQHYSLQFIITV